MIVATCATIAQAHKGLTGYIGKIVQYRGPLASDVPLIVFVYPEPQVATCIAAFQRVRIDFVTRQLLPHKVAVRFVLIE